MTQIQIRRGTTTEWTTVNPVLAEGEWGVELDTLKVKIGDGSVAWNALPYLTVGWAQVTGKPTVIAAGATAVEARTAISAASLDVNGKVPVSELPNSIMAYQGTWNPSTNTPTLADGTGNAGDVYRVSVTASRNLGSGSISFTTGDYVIYNTDGVWEKADTTDAVATVNGYTGNITLTKTDVGLGNVDNTSDAGKPVSTATQTALNAKANTDQTMHIGTTSVAINRGSAGLTLAGLTLTAPVVDAPSGTDPLTVRVNGTAAWTVNQFGELFGQAGTGVYYDSNISTTALSSTGGLFLTSGKGGVTAQDITLTPSGSGIIKLDGPIEVLGAVIPQSLNASSVGYLGMPANTQSATYTLVAADAGKLILHPSTDNNARTFTIPSNASVAFPVGTVISFANSVNTVTIAITSDTMTLAGSATTGSRTLAANGVATAIKVGTTNWLISGVGLT